MTTQLDLTDMAGSVLLFTDPQGAGPDSSYTPYGQNAAAATAAPGFNGERLDPALNSYHLGKGYRVYNPVLMRFNSPDSWSPFGEGGVNAYAWCEGDPINQRDPSGHGFILDLIEAIAAFCCRVAARAAPEVELVGISTEIGAATAMDAGAESGAAAAMTDAGSAIIGDRSLAARGDPVSLAGRMSDADSAAQQQSERYRVPARGMTWRQTPAAPDKVGRLVRSANGGGFEVESLLTGERHVPHQDYVYVNRVDEPHVLRVARESDVVGHTSLTQLAGNVQPWNYAPQDVFYAGEMRFDHGVLSEWSNDSGHYRPAAERRNTNMLPAVRALIGDAPFIAGRFRYELLQLA